MNVDSAINPIKVSETPTPGPVSKIVAKDSIIFIANGDKGIRIFNISNTSEPIELGYIDTDGSTKDLSLQGTYAYVADGNSMKIINVGDPSNPHIVGSLSCIAKAIDVQGHFAYVISENGSYGFRIIDIRDTLNPFSTGYVSTENIASDISVVDTLAFVADHSGGLRVYNITDSTNPTQIGYNDSIYSVDNITYNNGYVFSVNGYIGEFQIFHIEPNAHPTLVASVRSEQFDWDISVAGTKAYIADNGGLSIFNITNINSPTSISYYKTPSLAIDIRKNGNILYVGDYYSGVRVVDVTNPCEPTDVTFSTQPSWVEHIELAPGNLLYTTGDGGFNVVDISDPAHLSWLGNCNISGTIVAFSIFAYVLDGSSIQIVNVTNHTNPVLSNTINLDNCPKCAVVKDTLLIVGCAPYYDILTIEGGLRIYNISSPTMPVQIGYLNTGLAKITSIDIVGDTVFLAKEGFLSIDISNPTAPVLINNYSISDEVKTIKAANKYVYLGGYSTGLRIINISNPGAPFESGYYTFPTNTLAIDICGDTIYTANRDYGFSILGAYGQAGLRNNRNDGINKYYLKLWLYGNVLCCESSVNMKVTIALYNILGQHVRTLVDKQTISGVYRIPLNNIAAGIYFAHCSGLFGNVSKRIVIVK